MAVHLSGLRETIRSLERLGVAVTDMKAVFLKIGNMVAGNAQSLAPRRSGRLAASIKPSKTKNKALVRAGSARVPYAGVIHFGGYNNINANPFLTEAVRQSQSKAVQEMEDGLQDLIRKYGLK